MFSLIFCIALAGLFVSLYLFLLEKKVAKDPFHKPLCDWSPTFSCIKIIKSPYGRLLGYRNTAIGMIFYLAVALSARAEWRFCLLILSTSAVIVSCILVYISYSRIGSFCPVCIILYIINGLLFILSFLSLITYK